MQKLFILRFVLIPILVGSLLGCKSDEAFEDALNATRLYFEGAVTQEPKVECQFALQLVYFGNQPIGLYVESKLLNNSEHVISFDSKKDQMRVVVSEEKKYKVELGKSLTYEDSLGSHETKDQKFRISSHSLQEYVRKYNVAGIDYRFNNDSYECHGSFTLEK